MNNFKAIMSGNFGVLSVNRRLRELHNRVDELEALINGGPVTHEAPEQAAPVVEPESAKETETVDSAETEIIEADAGPAPFDWKTTEDVAALKEFAKIEFGLAIKGNKKVETVRAEIEGFLETL